MAAADNAAVATGSALNGRETASELVPHGAQAQKRDEKVRFI